MKIENFNLWGAFPLRQARQTRSPFPYMGGDMGMF